MYLKGLVINYTKKKKAGFGLLKIAVESQKNKTRYLKHSLTNIKKLLAGNNTQTAGRVKR